MYIIDVCIFGTQKVFEAWEKSSVKIFLFGKMSKKHKKNIVFLCRKPYLKHGKNHVFLVYTLIPSEKKLEKCIEKKIREVSGKFPDRGPPQDLLGVDLEPRSPSPGTQTP